MDGIVVIGEGEKDEAPMLYNGENIGDGHPPLVDIAVDPIDGTTLTSLGRPNAIAVIALSERGTMFNPGPCVYMEKIATGPDAADAIDLTASVKANLKWVAKALRKDVADVTAVDPRPRPPRQHHQGVPGGRGPHPAHPRRRRGRRHLHRLARIGRRHPLRRRRHPRGRHRRLRPQVPRRANPGPPLAPRRRRAPEGRRRCGYDLDKVLTLDDLVSGEDVFFSATGITDGELLRGVRFRGDGANTQSLVMRSKSGTIRKMDATHRWKKLMRYSLDQLRLMRRLG